MTEKNRTDFIHAYMTTALWSECRNDNTEDSDCPLDQDYGIDSIDDATKEKMTADCNSFLKDAADKIDAAIEANAVACGPDFDEWGRAGHDFCLTRNGHGAGFWDGDWDEPFGDELTEMSKKFGEFHLYAYDDKVGMM